MPSNKFFIFIFLNNLIYIYIKHILFFVNDFCIFQQALRIFIVGLASQNTKSYHRWHLDISLNLVRGLSSSSFSQDSLVLSLIGDTKLLIYICLYVNPSTVFMLGFCPIETDKSVILY